MTEPTTAPDLHRGLFTTLDRANPAASAVAIGDGRFTAVGHDGEMMKLAGERTRIIDLKGRRVLPGLIDNHLHIIRGGLKLQQATGYAPPIRDSPAPEPRHDPPRRDSFWGAARDRGTRWRRKPNSNFSSLSGSVLLRAGGAVRGNHMAGPSGVSRWRDR